MRYQHATRQQILKLFFMLFLLITWQPELLIPVCYALRAPKKKTSDNEWRGLKFCHEEGLPEIAREHTLFDQSIKNYFDAKEGVFRTHKMGLQKLDEECTVITSKQLRQLVTEMKSFLVKNHILFISEDHLDYLSTTSSDNGILLLETIMQKMPKNTILFTESELHSALGLSDFQVISLDQKSSYDLQLCRAVAMLPYIATLGRNPIKTKLSTFMQSQLSILLFYGDIQIWSQIGKNQKLSPGESSIRDMIVSTMEKNQKLTLIKMQTTLKNKLIPLFEKDNVNTFNIFIKFIQSVVIHTKKYDNQAKEIARMLMIKDCQKEVILFLDKIKQPDLKKADSTLAFKKFESSIWDFVCNYRNMLWIEKINHHIGQYVQQHNTKPYVVILAGDMHIKGLKQEFNKQQKHLHLEL